MYSLTEYPDSPSRHHLSFDRPFDKPFDRLTVQSNIEGLTVQSNVEGFMTLGKAEGLCCLRSLLLAA